MNDISRLVPNPLWSHFSAICAIPHTSGDETRLREHIMDFCGKNGIECVKDYTGNLFLKKNASSAELDSAPQIILQAHLDMVPQADSDINHDFKSDPITPVIDGGWVRAENTTLGADNGIGLSAILAIMESDDIPHGPLSAILTVEEETGLTGVNSLDPAFIDGDILINLDSEDFDEMYVACAGGCETSFSADLQFEPVPKENLSFLKLSVAGLEGGHSGVDIHLERGNAIIILLAALAEFADNAGILIHSLTGGSVANAIPREAFAELAVSNMNFDEVSTFVTSCEKKMKLEYAEDPNLTISVSEIPPFDKSISERTSGKIAKDFPFSLNGVVRMSDELPGIVETSSNVGVVKMDNGKITFITMQRSLIESEMTAIRERIIESMRSAGFNSTKSDSFPPWEPARDSRILKLCAETYQNLFAKKPKIVAIHAGLECGVIGRLKPELDMISFGPTIKYPHSPKEKVNIASVAEFWHLLTAVLSAATKPLD